MKSEKRESGNCRYFVTADSGIYGYVEISDPEICVAKWYILQPRGFVGFENRYGTYVYNV
jgi:hypothetical protein